MEIGVAPLRPWESEKLGGVVKELVSKECMVVWGGAVTFIGD